MARTASRNAPSRSGFRPQMSMKWFQGSKKTRPSSSASRVSTKIANSFRPRSLTYLQDRRSNHADIFDSSSVFHHRYLSFYLRARPDERRSNAGGHVPADQHSRSARSYVL